MFGGVRTISPVRASVNIGAIMRQPVTLSLPSHLVSEACLYAPGRSDLDAVCHVLEDYPRLVREIRNLRKSADSFAQESAELDGLVDELKAICLRVLDL